jgi:rubrerythrin
MSHPINANTNQTRENLQAAFAGESMANRKYLYFAKIARKLGNEEVARLFEDTANQETGHAFAHLDLIYPAADMTVEKLLQIAMEGELYETNQMYPEFERIAREEGNLAAVAEFQEQAQESAEHARLFENAARRFKALGLVEAHHAERYRQALVQVQEQNASETPAFRQAS